MKKSRLIGFLIAIALGVAVGLIYGWFFSPYGVHETSLESMRQDYKTDYVLMVAEVYASDGDLEKAIGSLARLEPRSPMSAVQQALVTAQQVGYTFEELEIIAGLEKTLASAGISGATP